MSGVLLDINVLIALVHEDHVAHARTRHWFAELNGRPWATCALTQAGFVRIVSNPHFSENRVDVAEAMEMLALLVALPVHRFWSMDAELIAAVQPLRARIFGHQQVTDAYLLGLAIQRRGRLVTLDQGIKALAGQTYEKHLLVLD